MSLSVFFSHFQWKDPLSDLLNQEWSLESSREMGWGCSGYSLVLDRLRLSSFPNPLHTTPQTFHWVSHTTGVKSLVFSKGISLKHWPTFSLSYYIVYKRWRGKERFLQNVGPKHNDEPYFLLNFLWIFRLTQRNHFSTRLHPSPLPLSVATSSNRPLNRFFPTPFLGPL